MSSTASLRRILALSIIGCAFTPGAHAQRPIAPAAVRPLIDVNDDAALQTAIAARIGLEQSSIHDVAFVPLPGIAQTITVPIDGVVRELSVQPNSVRSPMYEVLVQVEGGEFVPAGAIPSRTVIGVVDGVPGSRVAGAVHDDGVHLQVQIPGEPSWWVESIPAYIGGAPIGKHIVYRADHVPSQGSCGMAGAIDGDDEPFVPAPQGGGVAGMDECFWFTELATDTDFDFFQDYGTVSGAVNRINLVVNVMNNQYENQVGIHHDLTTVLIRSSAQDDPYPTGSQSSSSMLSAFRSEWITNQAGVQRDVAYLFSGKFFTGTAIGEAWTIGGMCSILTAYAVGENQNFLTCDTDLLAHELGHLWNAVHCAGGCGTTMNSGLTCANTFNTTSQNSIVSYRNSILGCLVNDCIPANNECDDAILVGSGMIPFSNENAMTSGPSDLLCAEDAGDPQVGADIWFRYEAECNGPHTFDVCAVNFNSKIALYGPFCPESPDAALACSDNDCGQGATLTHELSIGQEYIIRVGGFEGSEGTGTLQITPPGECVEPPTNDECGAAASFFETDGPIAFDSTGATTDGPDDSCATIERDIWYRLLNAACEDTITLSICDASFDVSMAVYGSGCPGAPEQFIACNDDDCGTGSTLSFDASPGIYRIRIGSPAGLTGTGTLVVECNEPPDCNDNGTPDEDDIAGGTSQDCNINGVPDECDIDAGTSDDLNTNDVPDECDPDCNGNTVPDDLDIANEISADCNTNGVPDECDIAGGTSTDDNTNGVPDECEPACSTDTDGNGSTDVDDLVAVIIDWGTDGSANNTDVDGSGLVDVDDLVTVILAWGPCFEE